MIDSLIKTVPHLRASTLISLWNLVGDEIKERGYVLSLDTLHWEHANDPDIVCFEWLGAPTTKEDVICMLIDGKGYDLVRELPYREYVEALEDPARLVLSVPA